MTGKQRAMESLEDFAARMAAKTQYGESASRNRVYLHPDDWRRILGVLDKGYDKQIRAAKTVDEYLEIEAAIDSEAQRSHAAIEAARRRLLAAVLGSDVPKHIDIARVRLDYASEYETVPSSEEVTDGWAESHDDRDDARPAAGLMVEVVEALQKIEAAVRS